MSLLSKIVMCKESVIEADLAVKATNQQNNEYSPKTFCIYNFSVIKAIPN